MEPFIRRKYIVFVEKSHPKLFSTIHNATTLRYGKTWNRIVAISKRMQCFICVYFKFVTANSFSINSDSNLTQS